MKTINELSEQIAVDHDYFDEHGLQRIDLEIACCEMARQMEEWIDVNDELPEDDADVIVKDMSTEKERVGYWNQEEWYVYGETYKTFIITHWRPINRK